MSKNKGIGAGGSKTNLNGLAFEEKTSIENKLLKENYTKHILNKTKFGYYFEKTIDNTKIIYFKQSGFKCYFKKMFSIDCYKCPDEAFLIINDDKYYLKILEKKNQNVEGSVEEKLKTGNFNKREIHKMININKDYIFDVSYAFCLSLFLQNKLESNTPKYNIIKEIMIEDDIKIFYGEDDKYFDNLYEWINKIK